MVNTVKPIGLLLLLSGLPLGLASAAPELTLVKMGGVNATQQDSACKGIVKDELGDPIIGASIQVKGTTNGTITDMDGNYVITDVERGETLVISYIGYQTQEVVWNGKDLIITLKEDSKQLEEVVVVGYGVQKKANLTGSVVSVDSEKLETRPVSSISAAIAGQLPGVTAIQNSGAPGSQSGSITIRGKNSINAADPLVIVDGIPGSMSTMNAIDPSDIESFTVLKDAASAAIYGVQAANGVILITTKQGKKGDKATVSYSGTVSWSSPVAKRDYVNAYEFATLYNEATYNENPDSPMPFSDADIEAYRTGALPTTDWYDAAFKKTGLEQIHNLSIRGGSEKTAYSASVGYTNQDGLTDAINYKRYNARMNVNADINKYVSLGLNASGYRGVQKDSYVGYTTVFQGVTRNFPTDPIYNEDGSFNYEGKDNPVAIQENNTGFQRTTDQEVNLTGYLTVNILPELSIKGVYSIRNYQRNQDGFKAHYTYGSGDNVYDSGLREGYEKYYNHNYYTGQILINYNKTFGKHTIGGLLGLESYEHTYKYTEAERKGGGNDELQESLNTLDASSQTNLDGGYEMARMSFFGRIQYDYASKYLFEFNLRSDASSRFPKDNRWGVFPALSAGWRLSEEAFIKDNADWLSNLKIRFGWGRTGNEELKNDDIYPAIATYAYSDADHLFMFNNSLYTTAYESRYVNNNLKWATVTNYEVGVEAGFLNNMLGFELAAYKKKTNDMLLYLPIQGVIGMEAPAQNAGSVENKGFDLNIFHNNRINKDWSYSIGLNVSYVKNEITNMSGTEGANPDNDKMWNLEGYPINAYYGLVADGFFDTEEELANSPKRLGTEKLGDIKYKDLNGDGKITLDADRQVIGKNFPSWTGGFNFSVTYKDFDLSGLFQGAFDVDGYYTAEAAYAFYNGATALKRHLDRWTPDHHDATYPRITRTDQTNFVTSSFWVQDASYVRLKNLTLGYSIPQTLLSKINIASAKVFLTGENLLTFTGLDGGLDPEEGNERGWSYGNVKKVSIGLKVSF